MEGERATGFTLDSGVGRWPKVAIIILNWNGWRDTIECLESVEALTYPNYEVILVDNGSVDDSVARIRDWVMDRLDRWGPVQDRPAVAPEALAPGTQVVLSTSRLLLVRSDENLGFCSGNNLGMRLAARSGADFLLILNNDTIVTPDFLQPMIDFAAQHPKAGLLGGVICYAENPNKISFAGGRFNWFLETRRFMDGADIRLIDKECFESECIVGCMMLIPRQVYEEVGGFRDDLFFSSEDWDYSLRVRRAGYRLFIVSDAVIFHKIGRSAGVMRPISYYYFTRNRLILKRLYLPWYRRWLFLVWFFITRAVRYAQFAVRGRWDLVRAGCDAIQDYFAGRSGKWRRHVG